MKIHMGKMVWALLFGLAMLAVYFYMTQSREHLAVPASGATNDAVKNIASAIDSVKGIEHAVGGRRKKPSRRRSKSRSRSRSPGRKRRSPKPHHGGKRSPKHMKKSNKRRHFTNPGVEGFDVMETEHFDSMGPEPAGGMVAPMGGEAKGSENFSLLDSSPF
jgi:hypothetical protein